MDQKEYTQLLLNVNKGSVRKKEKHPMTPKECSKEPLCKQVKKGGKAKAEMELVIKGLFPDYQKEYKFAPDRKFRADFYCPEIKCIIEYDGLFSDKSRHTGVVGFSKDQEKMNLATVLGYKVLRYSAMNYKNLGSDLWALKYTE